MCFRTQGDHRKGPIGPTGDVSSSFGFEPSNARWYARELIGNEKKKEEDLSGYAALLQKWGHAGWDEHIERVQQFYSDRRNIFLALAEKHLTGLATWWVPSAGMSS